MLNQTDYSDKLCQGNLLFRHLVKDHNAMSPLKKDKYTCMYVYILLNLCNSLHFISKKKKMFLLNAH